MKIKSLFILLGILLSVNVNVNAELKMPKIFSNNMVLQRDITLPIWGWTRSGEKVTINFKGQEKSTVASSNGKWMLKLDPLTASSEPAKLTVIATTGKKKFSNVLVGDVWLCSGQSNMGDNFNYPLNSKYPPGREIAEELKKIDNSLIRFVDRDGLGKVIPIPNDPPVFPYFGWQVCNNKTAKRFSRIGYYFGEKLQRELQIPIGLVNVSRGCSSIEAWMPSEAFESNPKWKNYLDEIKELQEFYSNYDQVSDEEKEKMFLKHCNSKYGEFPRRCYVVDGKLPRNKYNCVLGHMLVVKPASLYNHAIRSIIPFAFKGVIWYQGETNINDNQYACKQQKLIESWRKLWGQGDFPFYIVQLAPCRDGRDAPLPDFWVQQYEAVQKTPDTGLISAIDIGNSNEYHPKNKWDVGLRLALLALHDTYGRKDIVASGPTYKSLKSEGNKIVISFDYIGSGLITKDGKKPEWFEIAGTDRKFVKADAVIDRDKVIVSNSSVKNPIYVRYAWNSKANTNLCNKEGLPTFPFNTAEPFFQHIK